MDFTELYPSSEPVFIASHSDDIAMCAAPPVLGDLDGHEAGFEMSSPIVSSSSSFESDNVFSLTPDNALLIGHLKPAETEAKMQPLRRGEPHTTTPNRFPKGKKRKAEQTPLEKLDGVYFLQDLPKAPPKVDDFEDTFFEAKRRMDHNSHTRKSREKLNDKFERLVRVFPKADNDKDMRHKAQILEHSLATLENLLNENKNLEMELALLSRRNTVDWAKTVIASAKNEADAFVPLLKLICLKSPGCFGEVWKVRSNSSYEIIGAVGSKDLDHDDNDVATSLGGTVVELSREPLVRYCLTSMRSCSGNQSSRMTGELRWCRSISWSLAVPVIYSGRVNIVVTFYSSSRPFDQAVVETAELGATCLGNYFTSKLSRIPPPETPS
eukprot:Plantae.Rhodophyta-Purpureofilum_apyrenoidigerum.ctg23299.p1 GENE.Plantae.Rhodophyta-Purpureofilum_apyrenoidigerum.ctg23299~~Plantae.Rhodophyta-Purpureofilum_apyrenoidigerum.ctg23299.p1  ORF type:complete len:432 (+),score=66.10 Plantae.Rhodophyta-Purpureofilum_apyrenoidigerum.ctg23299:152-1297(+)